MSAAASSSSSSSSSNHVSTSRHSSSDWSKSRSNHRQQHETSTHNSNQRSKLAQPGAASSSNASVIPSAITANGSKNRHSSQSGAKSSSAAHRDRARLAKEGQLIEESRFQPLNQCLLHDEFPFLWACAAGDLKEVTRLLKEEQIEQQQLELKRIEHRHSHKDDRVSPEQLSEESYLQQVDELGWSGLHWAMAFNHVDIAQIMFDFFLETLSDEMKGFCLDSIQASELVQPAAKEEYVSPLYMFLNRTSNSLDTPFHLAAYNCHIDAMEWLIAHGADLQARNTENFTHFRLGHLPIMCLVECKNLQDTTERQADACRYLVRKMKEFEWKQWEAQLSEPNQSPEDVEFNILLKKWLKIEKAGRRRPDYIPTYLSKLEASAPAKDFGGEDIAASFKPLTNDDQSAPMTIELVDAEMMEVKKEDDEMLAKMESEPLPITMMSSTLPLPFDAAATSVPLVKPSSTLPANTAQVSKHDATMKEIEEKLASSRLLDSLSILNTVRESGSTPLMMAAFGGNIDVVLTLLQHGALVDMDNWDIRGKLNSDSPLLNAVDEGHIEVARLLLQWGADRFAKNKFGETAISIICGSEEEAYRDKEALQVKFITMLCTEGIDSASMATAREYLLNEANHDGITPFLWAIRLCRVEVVRCLMDLGCDFHSVFDPPLSEEHAIKTLIKKVMRGMQQNSTRNAKKRNDLPKLCALLRLFLQDERCVKLVGDVTDEFRAQVDEVVKKAEKEEIARRSEIAALPPPPQAKSPERIGSKRPREVGSPTVQLSRRSSTSSNAKVQPQQQHQQPAKRSKSSQASPSKQQVLKNAIANVAESDRPKRAASSRAELNLKELNLKEISKKESTKESAKPSTKESTKDSTKESTRESSKSSTKSSTKPSTKSPTKESATDSTSPPTPARFFKGGRKVDEPQQNDGNEEAEEEAEDEENEEDHQEAEKESDEEGEEKESQMEDKNEKMEDESAFSDHLDEDVEPLLLDAKTPQIRGHEQVAGSSLLPPQPQSLEHEEPKLSGLLSHESQVDDHFFGAGDHDHDMTDAMQEPSFDNGTMAATTTVLNSSTPTASPTKDRDGSRSVFASMRHSSVLAAFKSSSDLASSHHMDAMLFPSQVSSNSGNSGQSNGLNFLASPPTPAPAAPATTPSLSPAQAAEVHAKLVAIGGGLEVYTNSFSSQCMDVSEWHLLADESNADLLRQIIPILGHQLKFRSWVRTNLAKPNP